MKADVQKLALLQLGIKMTKITNADKIRIKQVVKQLGADKGGGLSGLLSFISGNYLAVTIVAVAFLYYFFG